MLSAEDAEGIRRAVDEFVAAYKLTTGAGTRTKLTIMQKDECRAKAERVIRKYANVIRANPNIDWAVKSLIGVHERARSTRQRKCPKRAPMLRFIGSAEPNGLARGKHILEFQDGLSPVSSPAIPRAQWTTGKFAKPPGAVRVKLFVGLFAQGEAVPDYPEQFDGRTAYAGSFTKNPIQAEFPVPAEPMWVVYWARWAGASCEVGPWSKRLDTRLEGYNVNLPTLPAKRMVIQRLERARLALIHSTPTGMPAQLADKNVCPTDSCLENVSDHEHQMLPAPDIEAA